ncbi:sugar phosphate isomerase/epimerase family protein [Dactylosporangium sp. CA-233914]|uniref:sugar phosphate isomerase/epimerase family protein n=1 Tax=Dactylosporangium sp. CA-233914 TaxID=3239934 RepID=UPI003D9076FE
MLRISCSDYTWPGLSHPTVLQVIRDIGFTGVDLGLFGDSTHLTLTELRNSPQRYAAEVRGRLAQHGLAAADLFLTPDATSLALLDPGNPDPADQARSLEIFDDTVAFAVELGVSGITLLPGVRHPGQTHREALASAANGLAVRVDRARAAGLRLSFEPHLGSVTDTVERIADLVAATPGLEVTLDPSHLAFAGATPAEMLELAAAVRHVQLRAGGIGKMQTRLADNEIDFTALLHGLWAGGYDGWLATEYVWMAKWDCDRVDNTAETIALKQHVEVQWAAWA